MNRIPLVIYGIAKEYPKFALRSISRHAKLPTPVDSDDVVLDKPNDNPGRPRKFTERDERSLVRPITTIHNTHGISFTAGKLKNEGDLHHVALILKLFECVWPFCEIGAWRVKTGQIYQK